MTSEDGAAGKAGQGATLGRRRLVGLALGPLSFVAVMTLPSASGLTHEAQTTGALAAWMALWWVTEAIPIAGTALLPIVVLPLFGVSDIGASTRPYAHPVIFLFLGGFLIGQATQRWELHRRIALRILRAVGTKPAPLIGGFMAAAALLSMWISNTATAVMMLPIGLSVIDLAKRGDGKDDRGFAVALMLGIAYSCSIGGLATPIGTPPNALLIGFMAETYGVEIGFGQWMIFGLPFVAVSLPMTWWLLTRWLHRVDESEIPGGREAIREQLRSMGTMSRGERSVAAVAVLTALAWVVRPFLSEAVPELSDAGIAIAAALLLFVLPADVERGEMVLDWESAKGIPWDALILFGGGLSLASAITSSGLSELVGGALGQLSSLPTWGVVLVVVAVVVFLTELTSNTATAAAFLPVVGSLAVGIGEAPLVLAVPTAIAASCAFMMPVATPPNTIIYGSGVVSIPEMVRAGFALNVVFVAMVAAAGYFFAPMVFGAV